MDGCRCGWFSVGFDSHGHYELRVFCAFGELLAYYHEAKLILVDIPIGLPDGPDERDADRCARKRLGPRRSSVFRTPTRKTVCQVSRKPKDYGAANRVEREIARVGLSRQAFEITRKIAEVDRALLARDRGTGPLIRESHPEICFWALNCKQPMKFNKRRTAGAMERIRVLKKIEPRTRQIFDKACCEFLDRGAAEDDILDALALAVTAYCGHPQLQALPDRPPKDNKGLLMEMVYYIPLPTRTASGATAAAAGSKAAATTSAAVS